MSDINEGRMYVVTDSVLPRIVVKVSEAKHLIESGACPNVQAAVAQTGISRSAYYKYRDSVYILSEGTKGKTVTMAMNLEHQAGLLSCVLNIIASEGHNILTINQTLPINNIANVTVTLEAGDAQIGLLIEKIKAVEGVRDFKILAAG